MCELTQMLNCSFRKLPHSNSDFCWCLCVRLRCKRPLWSPASFTLAIFFLGLQAWSPWKNCCVYVRACERQVYKHAHTCSCVSTHLWGLKWKLSVSSLIPLPHTYWDRPDLEVPSLHLCSGITGGSHTFLAWLLGTWITALKWVGQTLPTEPRPQSSWCFWTPS